MINLRSLRSIAVLLLGLFIMTAHARAQGTGRVVGRVVDAVTGAGISAAQVQIAESTIGALSALDGRYILVGAPAGQVTIRVSSIGYSTKMVVGIAVTAGGVAEQNVTLDTEAVQLGPLQVSAAAERGSVNRALDQQRTASAIVSAVTAEQISKSPDSDAAAAVQRVAGVTLMDGKYVQVRGLGERYTTTSLNGARIPSPEPERKLVPLDLFPSGLLETITTSKTFTPDQSGDFSGASVDIKLREFPAQLQQSASTSFGWNSAASGRTIFMAPTAGAEWLGLAAGNRGLPTSLRAAGNFLNSPSQTELNSFINSFRNSWSARGNTGRPNTSLGYSIGGNGPIFGQRVGYVVSGTYSYGQEIRNGEMRAQAQPDATGDAEEVNRYEGSTGRTSVLWGGVLNASTLIGSHSRLAINSTYNRSADNEARRELGESENYALPLEVTRLRYIERGVGSAQLLGEHEFGERNRINWSLTGSNVSRVEPDRSEFVYALDSDPQTGVALPPAWFSTAGEGAVRTFGDLGEKALEGNVNYKLSLGSARQNFLKLGAQYRNTERNSDNRAYGITAPMLDRASRQLRPEEIFDGRFAMPGMSVFRLAPLSQGGSYTAEDRLLAGYLMLDWGLGEKVRVITGARVEQSDVEIKAEPTVGAPFTTTPSFTDVLPAFTLNYQVSEQQALRFSVSQTLSRPEYRELAEIQYRDVIGGDHIIGNPELRRALIRNVDLRWELYPRSGEVLSVALFAKQFQDPIERVYLGTSGTRVITFLNAEGARNYGVELEARKRLDFLGQALNAFTLFTNATLMKSEIEIGDEASGASKISEKRAMVGQSPYVVNAGLTFAPAESRFNATLLYNLVGKRIVNAAERPLPNVFEQPRHGLDLALRLPIYGPLSAKLDLKNLLDSPYEVTQGKVTREYYNAGRVAALGFSWRP